jgi:two-component system sensor histidine kinase BaeS
MNRLWIWISVVIVGVVLIVTLFPFVYRNVTSDMPPGPAEGVPFDQRNVGDFKPEEFRQVIERRFWTNISRTLGVGALFALIAGVLLTRWLVAPLRELEQGAIAVTEHQWDYRVPARGSAEMRSVASSFNQMAAELEYEETLRRNMLADVSHELRHPVHIIRGNLQAILDGVYPLSTEEIDRLLDQTQNLTTLVDDLHELALAEAHELPMQKQDTDVNALVANAVEIFQPLAAHNNLLLTTEIPPEPVQLKIDSTRIRQALLNLLGNALRYTPQGGQVKVVLDNSEEIVSIQVSDSGVGIPPEDLDKVFDRFYRVDSSRDRDLSGTGLGLAVAQAIVQAHDGRIEVESAGVDQGSTFTVILPFEG